MGYSAFSQLGQPTSQVAPLLVPMEILTKIVKGCASDQSVRLISNGEEIKIRYMVAGSAVDRLVSHFSPTDWPEVKKTQGPEINLDDTFKQALREALECSSVDSSRYVLNGACMDVTEKGAHDLVLNRPRKIDLGQVSVGLSYGQLMTLQVIRS